MPRRKRTIITSIILVLLLGLIVTSPGLAVWRHPCLQGVVRRVKGQRTAEDCVRLFGTAAEERLRPRCTSTGVSFPPRQVTLLVFKDRKRMEVHVRDDAVAWRCLMELPILAASGSPGPKLREGDLQVPEGIYGIEALNPNSLFHVALRLNYPNRADQERARSDGRNDLGGDIMIHGAAASVGCLAMGDQAAEDLFILALSCGLDQMRVLIAPTDPRCSQLTPGPRDPAWVVTLYKELTREMAAFPKMTR